MPHKLISAIFAILLFVVIQTTSQTFRYFFSSMFLYMLVLLTYNYWYLNRHHLFSVWSWLKPLFLISGLVAVLLVLASGFLKGLYILCFIITVYFVELYLNLISEQVNFLLTLVSYFGICLGLAALSFYAPDRSTISLVFLGILTFMIARSSFDYIPQSVSKKNFYAAILAFSVLEISWTLGFLPFHFSIYALLLFNIFYFLWIIIYNHLFSNLSFKKISFHLIFSTLIIVLAIISTPWK